MARRSALGQQACLVLGRKPWNRRLFDECLSKLSGRWEYADSPAALTLDLVACYESESREFPHPRSPEALRAVARRWGSVVGLPAAEAFELVRSVRFGDNVA